MEVKLFKAGDKVQLKTGGPVMEVLRYVVRNNFFYPQHFSTDYVECRYFRILERDWKQEVFHQNNLIKIGNGTPVWVENLKSLFEVKPRLLLN